MPIDQEARSRQSLIEKVITHAKNKIPETQVRAVTRFMRYALVNMSEEDFNERTMEDLFGSLLSFWNFIATRTKMQRKFKLFNPTEKKDGFSSTHTVIQLVQTDMPFLVDSIIVLLNQLNINIHLLIHGAMVATRNDKGVLADITPYKESSDKSLAEAPIYIEIDRQLDDKAHLEKLEKALLHVLDEVHAAVADYQPMKEVLRTVIAEFEPVVKSETLKEATDFLKWIDSDHFTFLGYSEFKVIHKGKQAEFKRIDADSLGLAKITATPEVSHYENLTSMLKGETHVPVVLVSKSRLRSNVHRGAYKDIIDVLHFGEAGEVIGKSRFVGLFTSVTYHSNPHHIPLLRKKIDYVLKRSGYAQGGHNGKRLLNILETFPRDELFQISTKALYHTVLGVLQLQERQRVRLFVRQDPYGQYYSCMVYVPRERYDTELRTKIQHILMRELKGQESIFTPHFLENSMCRVDYVIRVKPGSVRKDLDVKKLESKVVLASRDWSDDLSASLKASYDEQKAHALFARYEKSFSAGYKETFIARSAVSDIEHVERVLESGEVDMRLYCMMEEPRGHLHFKLFQKDSILTLSHCLPIFENLGLTVLEERPYKMNVDGQVVWISDFAMCVTDALVDPYGIADVFKEAFSALWYSRAENDGFNRLVMRSGLPSRSIVILRTIAKYLLQTGIRYSQAYMEQALAAHPEIATALVDLFDARFNPAQDKGRQKRTQRLENDIRELLAKVKNLDEDRMLRRFKCVIKAILRTNYYQLDAAGDPKAYVSIKLDPECLTDMPKPLPKYEIFVYSPRVEGIHLRCGKVARGGLRWSDRREDFRTEVLGLMKAQQVKNAVIVPVGAKGGFVAKCLPQGDRDAFMAEGIACYKIFIRALLDVTDNYVKNKVVHPENVVRYDDNDPYLVVAADKGTATFSDIANGVAEEYGFWLGDAFASGGSNGYDHKKMGITARGAWESVKRHFFQVDKDIQSTDFTAVGIGDMSGDVFGNGMLLSHHTRLLAAFNHMHIFIDPNPDAAKSFIERKRLFDLPRSTWEDYNQKLISKGGGVYARDAKSIPLSVEARTALGISEEEIEPNALIQFILKADVDLLWNGGIGTYVKASHETHLGVGDRANDVLRINGNEIRAQVVGEGGNLGLTQASRVEFALKGGRIYTDAVDNSAGVDCSDHEVNIKILLNDAVLAGRLKPEERNGLLATMDKEVGDLVLKNNYEQTQILAAMLAQKTDIQGTYTRLLCELEREANLSREIEVLPTDKEIRTRLANGQGLISSELSVLMAYAKSIVKVELGNSPLWKEPYFQKKYLTAEFPAELQKRFYDLMPKHRLARDIVITQLTNTMMHRMGITFVHLLYDETGASTAMIARAFSVNYEVLELEKVWHEIDKLDGKVDASVQSEMINELGRLMCRLSRWLLCRHRSGIDVEGLVATLSPKFQVVRDLLPKMLYKQDMEQKNELRSRLISAGVPKVLADKFSDVMVVSFVYDIVEAAERNNLDLVEATEVYLALNEEMSFAWMRAAIINARGHSYWDVLSSSALRDDLDKLQRIVTATIMQNTSSKLSVKARIATWCEDYRFLVNRWRYMVEDIKVSQKEYVRYSVALRCLLDLAQASMYGAKNYTQKNNEIL